MPYRFTIRNTGYWKMSYSILHFLIFAPLSKLETGASWKKENAKDWRGMVQKDIREMEKEERQAMAVAIKQHGKLNPVGQCPRKIPQYERTQLANGLEKKWKQKGSKGQDKGPRFISILRTGEKTGKEVRCWGILVTAKDREMRDDLIKQLKFPGDYHNQLPTWYRILVPDIKNQVALIGMTVPWEKKTWWGTQGELGK